MVIVFLKANPNHDRLGRFARAPDKAGGDGGVPVDSGQDIGRRAFSEERARLMDGIAVTLARPTEIRRQGDTDDLFVVIERGDTVYKVALESTGHGRYRSRVPTRFPSASRVRRRRGCLSARRARLKSTSPR